MLEQHLTAFIVNYYYYYSRDKFNRDNLYTFTSTVKFSGKISFSKNIARRCWGRSERERERERRGVLGCSRAWNRGRAQFRVSTSDDPLLRPGHPTAIRYSPLFLHRFQLFVVLSSPTGYFRMENRGEKEKKRSLFPFFLFRRVDAISPSQRENGFTNVRAWFQNLIGFFPRCLLFRDKRKGR